MNHLLRASARFLLNPPPLGPVPARVNLPLQQRLLDSPVARMAANLRARAYFEAGCPNDLCDTAAARDIWLEVVPK